MERGIRFLKNGELIEVDGFPPAATLLDYIRETRRETGTKEGCAEGDCGACSVAIGEVRHGLLRYRAVNACIYPLGALDGKELVTIEDLAGRGEALHPVQEALVRHHGSQCGFCTPGFVMALFALYHETQGPVTRGAVNDAIAGNLCRCTGYRPIVDAALEACAGKADDRFSARRSQTISALESIAPGQGLFVGNEASFFAAPVNEASLAALYAQYPDATLVAGATDVGLWITKQLRDLPRIIHMGCVRELLELRDTAAQIEIGAAVTYADAYAALAALDPDIGELVRRLGSAQVRNMGTVGGNIANGSPIGDSPPMLIALGASIVLRKGDAVRAMPLEDFFTGYGKQDRQPGEFISRIIVPKPGKDSIVRCYKISKRFDQDITACLGAFHFTLTGGTVTAARIAYGGMAATPKRANHAEKAAIGLDVNDARGWSAAIDALERDFTPLSDMRASAEYRMDVAKGLLHKALIEAAGTQSALTRVQGLREAVHG